MKEEVKIKVFYFQHCRKGETADSMPNSPLPGDALLAEVEVEGKRMALCAIAQKFYAEDVKPYEFEAALKAFLAALAQHLGEPPPPDIETRLVGVFKKGVH